IIQTPRIVPSSKSALFPSCILSTPRSVMSGCSTRMYNWLLTSLANTVSSFGGRTNRSHSRIDPGASETVPAREAFALGALTMDTSGLSTRNKVLTEVVIGGADESNPIKLERENGSFFVFNRTHLIF